MGFFEDDRIRNKQYGHILFKARGVIREFTDQGVTGAKLLNLLKARSKDTYYNETEREIFVLAIEVLESK